MNIQDNYLTNIPSFATNFGFSKVLAVRREIIHIKHIMTEVFVRKTIPIETYLDKIGWTLFKYMEYITNRIRRIHYFSREYNQDCNRVIKDERDNFFPTLNLLEGFKNCIVLDFDGVVTSKRFRELYGICINRAPTYICTANPLVSANWFASRSLIQPRCIFACRGKVKKIRQLIEIQKAHDYVFYVDDEKEYLEYAWLFGLQTYSWEKGLIKYFSKKTK